MSYLARNPADRIGALSIEERADAGQRQCFRCREFFDGVDLTEDEDGEEFCDDCIADLFDAAETVESTIERSAARWGY